MLTNDDLKKVGEIIVKAIDANVPGIIEKKLKPIRSDIDKIKKDLDAVIRFFDRNDLDKEKRIRRIEDHLGFSRPVA